MDAYEGNTVQYDCGEDFGSAQFIPKCPVCGRFVKADKTTPFRANYEHYEFGPNATCTKHGHVEMPFEGWF